MSKVCKYILPTLPAMALGLQLHMYGVGHEEPPTISLEGHNEAGELRSKKTRSDPDLACGLQDHMEDQGGLFLGRSRLEPAPDEEYPRKNPSGKRDGGWTNLKFNQNVCFN